MAINTLKTALKKEKHPKVILHSDQGVQFTSCEFVNFCKDNNITQSMSKAGCPYDNAPMERFYNTFKNCFYYRYTFESVEQLDEMTKQYINWYNYVRPHSTNNYMTPMEFRYRVWFPNKVLPKSLTSTKLSDRNSDLENRVDRLREEVSIIKKENVSLLNVAYDMDRVVVVLGENKVKEAIEVAKHLEQTNAKQNIKKKRIDRDSR